VENDSLCGSVDGQRYVDEITSIPVQKNRLVDNCEICSSFLQRGYALNTFQKISLVLQNKLASALHSGNDFQRGTIVPRAQRWIAENYCKMVELSEVYDCVQVFRRSITPFE
jgi:hypothetical protein